MKPARPPLVHLRHPAQAVAGFTLIESVMVIALLAIVAAYLAPKAFDYAPLTLNAQSRNFVAGLQQAQLLAITEGVAVNVKVSSKSYTLPLNMGSMSTQTVDLESDTSFDGVSSSSPPIVYYFDSLGQPTDSTGQPISVAWSFQLKTSSQKGPIVSVEPVSGLITGP